jgi:hypothetical protein
MTVTLEQVASALGRPAGELQELDRRPVRLAFLERTYETVVVRDRADGRTVEATFDAETGERADADDLRQRDRELAEDVGSSMSAALMSLVQRHPELAAIRVAVTREGSLRPQMLRASPRSLIALARQPDVASIELAEDPEILD